MNRVYSICGEIAIGIAFSLFSAFFASAETGPDPAPFSKDQYSGKTVRSFDQGYDIVLSRFYNAPSRGSQAPELRAYYPAEKKQVGLADLIEAKPLVLIFGSYGCDILYNRTESLNSCHREFGEKVNFFFVYIREAHSLDALESTEYPLTTPIIADPKTPEERVRAAEKLSLEKEIPFPFLIDDLDDPMATRWAAWPVRAYVVDTGKTVVYAGRPGPWGFFPSPEAKPDGFDRMNAHADRFNQESLYEFLESYLGEESQ